MTRQALLKQFEALPSESKRAVARFIASLLAQTHRQSPATRKTKGSLANDSFVGIWQDRTDLADSR